MLHLAGVSKHAGLRVAGYKRCGSSTGVNESNGSVDCWEIEVRTFDHPWSELDDLFRRECLLRHESADHRVADVQRSGGLLHSDPEALIRWWTSRKALGVANVLHALLRPGVVVAGAIANRFRIETPPRRLNARPALALVP